MEPDFSQLRLFLATEHCEVVVSRDREAVLRRPENAHDIWLLDPSIPRDGIGRLRIRDGVVEIVPGSPTSPVLLNGERIDGARPLRAGDRIRVGYSTLVVQSIGDATERAPSSVKTLQLETSFLQRRTPLGNEVDRLAQWSEAFEMMRMAEDEEQAAGVILNQLTRLVGSTRGVIAIGQPLRAIGDCGLTAAEVERVLRWLMKSCDGPDVQTPTVKEVLDSDVPHWAAVGRHGSGDDVWCFYLETGPQSDPTDLVYRARSVLANMVLLYGTLHEQHKHAKLVQELSATVRAYARPAEQQDFDLVRSKFVFRSEAMSATCRSLARAAAAPSPVLLLGERGTGKQLAAEALHAASRRRNREMIAVNLTEFPESLIESQLFGHTAGSYTGAGKLPKLGLVERAHGSTLFLDEIGEAPLSIQAKLLRVLEYGVFWQIGGARQTKVDIRVITATNRDLLSSVKQSQFRQDLFDRISVIPIVLPPLRERPEDIPLLVDRFLHTFNSQFGKQRRISAEGVAFLGEQPWPDNVRGLRNFIERVVVMADHSSAPLGRRQLEPFFLTPPEKRLPSAPYGAVEELLQQQGRINQSRILRALAASDSRQSKSEWSERVGISRPVFRRELHELMAYALEHGIPLEFFERRVSLQPEDWKYLNIGPESP